LIFNITVLSLISIPFNSCHFLEHKLTTLRFLTNRPKIYQLRNEDIKKEILRIQNILYNNSFPIKFINKFVDKHNNSTNPQMITKTYNQEKNGVHFSFWKGNILYYEDF